MAKRAAPKKRKAATASDDTPAAKKKAKGAMFGKNKKKGASSSTNGVQDMFLSIAEDPDDANSLVTMEGIAELGDKLGIDATEDIRILVLLWKMGCNEKGEKPGCITADEWTKGCEKLRVDSWESLKDQLPSLDTGFLEATTFRELYKFCFKFNLSGTHRTLQKEVTIELLKLTLKDRIPTDRVESIVNFLNNTDGYSQITMDQWCSILDFFNEIGADDTDLIANYDQSTSAWPVLIDEYVEYIEKQRA